MEAAKHIREAGYKEPIIALSANAVEGQSGVFLQNGFDDFISKPIDMRQLNVIMNNYVRDKQPQEVIDEARRQAQEKKQAQQAQKQKNEKPAEDQIPSDSLFYGVNIPGLDIAKGIKRFNGDEKTYMDVLRSYAANVGAMLDIIEIFNEESLADYIIKVHGIKGTSFDIFAEQAAEEAKDLEAAGKAGDLEFIRKNHPAFMEEARKLVSGIEDTLSSIDMESDKPLKDKPDIKLFLKLINACNDFDMDGADEAMAELEKYKYETDNDLIGWLRGAIDMMQFKEIAQKLGAFK